ncbi:exodeoxyribonuclease V subunit alpha [Catenovulum adriaticum]|uniref:RecBCD enzyme subunit RecD n=1 Tax=Catenovulum adriaticum TaxID=2984846 RepID=A0ABY7ARQ6_9ALTE|nr:exodeoxyribonuclease V subunit alpha [Catenovulum sp. TS8]WAJ71457.1 exodeoxyribonuclease V subunit alpha [Catenovulum sp. TS8]
MNPVYLNLIQCQQALDSIEAIDYFFADKMFQFYQVDIDSQSNDLQPRFDENDYAQIFHLFLALQWHQRQGHSCLPLKHIAGITLWENEVEQTVQLNSSATLPVAAPAANKPGFLFADHQQLTHLLNRLIEYKTKISTPVEPFQQPIIVENLLLKLSASSDNSSCHVTTSNQNTHDQSDHDITAPSNTNTTSTHVYLRRYWQFENEVAQKIKEKSQHHPVSQQQIQAVKDIFTQLFPQTQAHLNEPDWQQVAVANALGRKLSIICGGPGTGKTYTVTRLLAALQASSLADSHKSNSLNIKMAAPTGKAAQRLKESICGAKEQLKAAGLDLQILDAIPEEASTLHRLLGIKPNQTMPKYNPLNLLECDLLLIDEISMIDLAMMARLLRALPDSTRLILLGDAQQLPSVETGNILADLVANYQVGVSPKAAEQIKQISGQAVVINPAQKADHISFLTKTHRFGGQIGEIAKEVITANPVNSWQRLSRHKMTPNEAEQLKLDQFSDSPIELALIEPSQLETFINAACQQYYLAISRASSLKQAFDALAKFRILVPNRVGQTGVEQLNIQIEQALSKKIANLKINQHYAGRPVMVTENSYTNGLFNGDIGLIWADENNKLQAYFETESGYKKVSLARLPLVETVYAMTIHKTQGSEFSQVALILPEQTNPLLSPELIYTGLTRAKQKLIILAAKPIWYAALNTQLNRYSGLAHRLINFSQGNR